MPIYLKDINDFSELERFESVLIVPCRFCPAASMAVRKNAPYFEVLKNLLKTASYEEYIEKVRSDLKEKGLRVDIFRSYLPHQFVVCMWTSRRRKKLLERADKHEALVVIGCEAAAQTICDSVKSISCRVFMGMRNEGIMSIKPIFRLPLNVSLELNNVIPLVNRSTGAEPWICL